MVRLKERSAEAALLLTVFQFPNGSIKRRTTGWTRLTETMFQFPNGSIKSQANIVLGGVINKFQFPNGSIKRLKEKFFSTNFICFNSLMVRLKGTTLNKRVLPK